MDSTLPLVSVVCSTPQGGTLADFHGALFRVLRGLESAYRFEILYADVRDGNAAAFDSLAQLDPRLRHLPPAADGEALLRSGLTHATGDMMILMDAGVHSPELLPRMLELVKGPCAVVEGVPENQSAPARWRRWPQRNQTSVVPNLLLLKRTALDLLRASAADQQSLHEKLRAANLPRAELTYAAPTQSPAAPAARLLGRLIADVHAAWKSSPFTLVAYFGAMVFCVGIFLAFWFSLQSLVAPSSIWFSWCYLIVLLHVLGGSILIALGKLGAVATRILAHVQVRRDTTRTDSVAQNDVPTILPRTRSREAA